MSIAELPNETEAITLNSLRLPAERERLIAESQEIQRRMVPLEADAIRVRYAEQSRPFRKRLESDDTDTTAMAEVDRIEAAGEAAVKEAAPNLEALSREYSAKLAAIRAVDREIKALYDAAPDELRVAHRVANTSATWARQRVKSAERQRNAAAIALATAKNTPESHDVPAFASRLRTLAAEAEEAEMMLHIAESRARAAYAACLDHC